MARAAFVMDRVMRAVGLHGKSFNPLLVGFGCSVPAIMGTRTLESPRDRMVTILVAPLMSCSARLPVYTLLTAAFFPRRLPAQFCFRSILSASPWLSRWRSFPGNCCFLATAKHS
jgi:ferrous iron transport protein B